MTHKDLICLFHQNSNEKPGPPLCWGRFQVRSYEANPERNRSLMRTLDPTMNMSSAQDMRLRACTGSNCSSVPLCSSFSRQRSLHFRMNRKHILLCATLVGTQTRGQQDGRSTHPKRGVITHFAIVACCVGLLGLPRLTHGQSSVQAASPLKLEVVAVKPVPSGTGASPTSASGNRFAALDSFYGMLTGFRTFRSLERLIGSTPHGSASKRKLNVSLRQENFPWCCRQFWRTDLD
jgi:hypothetical protein